ncbi:MAG: hypothetical protein LYZ69_06650 [Nitrososphaerales archaeon]|nr:hypothetical protein [Nitrososphaerales archaeon]
MNPASDFREARDESIVHESRWVRRVDGFSYKVRDRGKVMHGLKRMDTPILKGVQIYHNYIRRHEGLKGETPADKAGIRVEGEDKWRTLIQNASRKG